MRTVKILMLHGYTQSGPLFQAKTRALEKVLAKALSPVSLAPSLIYPTGPVRLLPHDIPGYSPPSDPESQDYQPDAWAWWRKDDGSGEYLYLEQGMATVADAIRQAGGIDGVCGFSQGGAAASLVTAALEPDRPVPDGKAGEWVRRLRQANGGLPAKFVAVYSGFRPVPASLQFLYEPKIKTPTLHFLGSLDTIVDESRSRELVDRCDNVTVVSFPGGHHVPISKDMVMPLAGLVKVYGAGDPVLEFEL
ncbi:hypothetical protein UVI_02056690 [Ustilaginoidea virens]|nr:hypothetical protein UVI_02056690 [Ustilaginoidea virens]